MIEAMDTDRLSKRERGVFYLNSHLNSRILKSYQPHGNGFRAAGGSRRDLWGIFAG